MDRFPEAARLYRGREPEALRWGTRIENDGVMDLIKPADVSQGGMKCFGFDSTLDPTQRKMAL